MSCEDGQPSAWISCTSIRRSTQRRTTNILYGGGCGIPTQVRAFTDTWHWDEAAAARMTAAERAPGRRSHRALTGLQTILGESGMLAYLTYMTERLEECRRVMHQQASVYLHCDPTASHYLKILCDAVYGLGNFRNEIIWKRSFAHSDTKQGGKRPGRIRDTLLFYTMSEQWTWNPQYTDYDEEYVKRAYRHVEEETGRRYRLGDITGPGGTAKGSPEYEVMGVTRAWRYSNEEMQKLIAAGRIVQTAPGRVPAYKQYLDEMPGVVLQDLWSNIAPVSAAGAERLGYPTQKPVALLRRIIEASSNPNDVILDPFCGCGTTIAAAEIAERKWVGIDVSPFAVKLVRDRRAGTRRSRGSRPTWKAPRCSSRATPSTSKPGQLPLSPGSHPTNGASVTAASTGAVR